MKFHATTLNFLACIVAVTAIPAAAPIPYNCPGAPDQCRSSPSNPFEGSMVF